MRNKRFEEITDKLIARGFGEELFDIEMRLAELDVEIELYTELGKVEKLEAAKLELAELLEQIGPDAQEYYDALLEDIRLYNAACAA